MRTTTRTTLALLALAAGVLVAWPGCSLIVDTKADQCTTDVDCKALGGGTCQGGVCTGGAPLRECSSNADCKGRGDFWVCNKTAGTCASLHSTECTTVDGDYTNDDAFLIGSILPTAGPDKDTGHPMENSIRLALADFIDAANGLPKAGGGTRPFVLVGCNDNSDADVAVTAAKHLANDIGVPAIIGAAFSGITIKVATTVTIPAGVLLISPSATSVAITDLQDNGLVWRTSPSDVFQAKALALLMPQIEAAVHAELPSLPQGAGVRVAILNKGDSYGSGLGKALEKILTFNGKPALDDANRDLYKRLDYGNPDDPTADPTRYPDKVAQILAFKPHVVLVFGTNEGVTNVFSPIVDGWANATKGSPQPLPRFLFSDGGEVPDLWDKIGANKDLRSRILGTVPGTNNGLYLGFKSAYKTKFSNDGDPAVFGAAGSYDAAYLLGFAAVAIGAQPVTGANLVGGLKKEVPPGTSIDVGTDSINPAFKVLEAGKNIDFNGSSGPLDFDVTTGDAPSDIQIWCMPADGSGKATSAMNSGEYFDASKPNAISLAGTIGAVCQ
jgi:branched-chain amino acid transport system substrate-binding protein